MTISSVTSNSALTLIDSPYSATSATSANTAALADTAVGLSSDSGVLVFLGGSAPAADSATQLYTALVNAGNASSSAGGTAAPSDPASANISASSDTSTAAPATTNSADTSASPSNLNADWSTILQSNPSLASLVDSLSVQQALVNAIA